MITTEFGKNEPIFIGDVETFLYQYPHYSQKENAFIGTVGNGPKNKIYLCSFQRIILLEDPMKTWVGKIPITVQHFVNIKVTAWRKHVN